jgi:hypothetical protein
MIKRVNKKSVPLKMALKKRWRQRFSYENCELAMNCDAVTIIAITITELQKIDNA